MAFTLEVVRGSTSYNISNGAPFSFEEADLGGLSVRNIEESGPFQDGSTHLANRLEPDVMTLRMYVSATSAAALDGYRDTLNAMFKPVVGIPVTLKLTRDDGEVRQRDTQLVRLNVPLQYQNRPGNLHKVVVQLRAADPTWYDPALTIETFSAGSEDWYLASGLIGTANVHSHVENVGTAGTTTVGSELFANQDWSAVFYGNVPPNGTVSEATIFGPVADFSYFIGLSQGTAYPLGRIVMNAAGTGVLEVPLFSTGNNTYFVVSNNGTIQAYRNNVAAGGQPRGDSASLGTAFEWVNGPEVGGNWGTVLLLGALYDIALSSQQRSALHTTMSAGTSLVFTRAIDYGGDLDAYPIITLGGPLADPIITNNTTGDVLNFTGGTLGTADQWTIDLRYGHKSALDTNGSSVLRYLSNDSTLSTFRMIAEPLASGGTNSITVQAGTTNPNSFVEFAYNERFAGF